VPGGKPVTAEPGLKPKFPLITLEPVFVIVEPARIAKLSAVPRFTEVADITIPAKPTINAKANTIAETLLIFFIYFI